MTWWNLYSSEMGNNELVLSALACLVLYNDILTFCSAQIAAIPVYNAFFLGQQFGGHGDVMYISSHLLNRVNKPTIHPNVHIVLHRLSEFSLMHEISLSDFYTFYLAWIVLYLLWALFPCLNKSLLFPN